MPIRSIGRVCRYVWVGMGRHEEPTMIVESFWLAHPV